MICRKTPNYQRSQGVVLIVALVLLLALTLIGVSSIDSSSLQAQMSRNSLFARSLMQANYSEISAQMLRLKDMTLVEDIINSTTTINAGDNHGGVTYTGPGVKLDAGNNDFQTVNPKYNYEGVITYTGDGGGLPSGYKMGMFQVKNFEINIITTVKDTSAVSNQTQGVKAIAPADSQQ